MRLNKKITNLLKNLSMRTKLIISYFTLISFSLMIVGIFAYASASSGIKQEVSRYSSEVLQQMNNNINNSLTGLNDIALSLGSDPQIQKILMKNKDRTREEFVSDDEYISSKIEGFNNVHSYIRSLFIFSYNGETYSYNGSDNSIKTDYNFTRTRWFSTMKSLGLNSLLLPTHEPDETIYNGHPRKVFTLIKAIDSLDSFNPIGYIMIDIDTQMFKDILSSMNLGPYQELMVIDSNKTILYDINEEYISTQFRSEYLSRLLEAKTGSMTEYVEKKPMLITFNTSPSTNWTVISIIPVNVLYSNVYNLEYVIYITMFICILLSFCIAVIISRTITKPLSTLKSHMKKVESGQFDISVPVKSNDEIGGLSVSFNHMLSKIKELIVRIYQTEILKKEAELGALQEQINPHFLYNTLQIMDIIAEREGVETISSICQALSKMFRYSINRGKEIVSIADEIEHVKNYIYIQKIRFNNKFEILYNIEEEILKYQTIKLVLQPIIENAMIHGIGEKIGHSTIEISGRKAADIIEIEVKDTGIGINEHQLQSLRDSLNDEIIHAEVHGTEKKSIGIKNVHARLKLYYGEAFGISIDSEPNLGTKVRITLPAVLYSGNSQGGCL